MNQMPRAVEVRVHDADHGAGEAFVDCPRQGLRMPLLVCRDCERCLRVAESGELGLATSIVCMLR
jgi:hypothetical protein